MDRTPSRPSAWSRTTPTNVTTLPVDVGAARPVPDPMDRTWRHPSEFGRRDVPPVSTPPRPRRLHRPRTRTWSLALGAAVAGSAITVGALAAAGTFNVATPATIVPP